MGDRGAISCAEPEFYAERFMRFIRGSIGEGEGGYGVLS